MRIFIKVDQVGFILFNLDPFNTVLEFPDISFNRAHEIPRFSQEFHVFPWNFTFSSQLLYYKARHILYYSLLKQNRNS